VALESSQASSESEIGNLVKQASMEQPNCASDMISTYHNIRPSPPKNGLTSQEQTILQRYMDNLQEVSNEEDYEEEVEEDDVRSRHSHISRHSQISKQSQQQQQQSIHSRQSSHNHITIEEAIEVEEEHNHNNQNEIQIDAPIIHESHHSVDSSDGEETIAGDHMEFQQQQAINMAIIEAALNAESSDCIDDTAEYELANQAENQSDIAPSTSSEARLEGIQAQIAQNLQQYNAQREDGISIVNLRAGISTETAPVSLPPQVAEGCSTFDFCV
jgi:hypothetical protein